MNIVESIEAIASELIEVASIKGQPLNSTLGRVLPLPLPYWALGPGGQNKASHPNVAFKA